MATDAIQVLPAFIPYSNVTAIPTMPSTLAPTTPVIWEQVYGGLKVWSWAAIAGGVALLLS